MTTTPLDIEIIPVGSLQTNCYLLIHPLTHDAIIVDPGGEPAAIIRAVKRRGAIVRQVVNTHGHGDHIMANTDILNACPGATLAIHEKEAGWLRDPKLNCSIYIARSYISPPADVLLHDNDEICCGDVRFRVIHTPGHTPGGICLVAGNILISGDTLFAGTVGRCDLSGGDEVQLLKSLNKLKQLPGDMIIYPGHGPATIMSRELLVNPYLNGEP